jgi:hypothetical protein
MCVDQQSKFFTENSIRSLRFYSMRKGATTIKTAAMLYGFKLASYRCLSIPYGRLYCLKGGGNKNN